jgi:hypothetical protein
MKQIDLTSLNGLLTPDEIEALRKQITEKVSSRVHTFTPILMLERGLGQEFRNLENVSAGCVAEAEKEAQALADAYIKQPGYEKAVILEVRLRLVANG